MPNDEFEIERDAKLFEAGEYPDKGVTVTEDDLDRMVASFDAPLPLHVEHQQQPLQLGFLTRVWRAGRELFGRIRLHPEANALIEKSGARRLSVALSQDLAKIAEVSLVRHPRVADARIFADALYFHSDVEFEVSSESLADRLAAAEARASRAETAAKSMAETLREARVDATIERLKHSGRLAPAAETQARALLRIQQTVQFGDENPAVGVLFERFLGAQPPVVLFGETASAANARATELDPDEAAYFKRHFPNLDLRDIARHRKEA